MGRNAKLRQQRKQTNSTTSALPPKRSRSPEQSIRAEVPAPVRKTSLNPAWQNKLPPFLQKLTSRFSAPGKQAQDEASIEVDEFFQENTALLAAIAWEGYQTYGRGIVFAFNSGQPLVQIEYVPRKSLRKYLDKTELEAFANMLEVYEPEKDLVITYLASDGEVMLSSHPDVQPSPPECYRMRQQGEGLFQKQE
jgi:hypothetical protein